MPAGDHSQHREFRVALLIAVLLHVALLWLLRIHLQPRPKHGHPVMQLHVVKPAHHQAKRTAVRKTQPGARPSKHPITQAPTETSVVVPTTRIKPATAPSTAAESKSRPLDLTVVAPPQRSDNANQFGKPAQPNTMYLHRPLLKPQRKFTNLPKSIWRPTRVVSVDSYYSSDGTPESVTVMDNGDIIICKRQRYLFDQALDGAQLGLCFTVQDQW